MIGTTLGRYMLLREVGRGGMSTVYLAEDTALERQVAVKVLHPHLASRPESCARFSREARAIARLRHPNIVEIFDCSPEDADTRYIVTEFIDGPNLRDFVEAHDLSCPELGAALGFALCEALEHAHSLGIIHRDIKPENVLLHTEEGRLKLTDFGIAQILDADTLTATGSLLGSPAHMPPEMIDGLPVDFRGDIFSLGTVLYFLATNGLLPFEGKTPSAVLRNILEGRYRDPEAYNPRVGRQLSRIIKRCMARQPTDRFATVADVKQALRDDLATLGFDDPADVARNLLQRPDEYPDTFERLVVERLLNAARASLRRRQVALAIDHINRALAYVPTHPVALDLLAQVQRRHRLRLVAAAAVAVALVAAATYRLSPQWSPPTSQAAISGRLADPTDPAPDPSRAPSPAALTSAQALQDATFTAAVIGVAALAPHAPPPALAELSARARALAHDRFEASVAVSASLLARLRDPELQLHKVAADSPPSATSARLAPHVRPHTERPGERSSARPPTSTSTSAADPTTPTDPPTTRPPQPATPPTPVSFQVFPRETSFAKLSGRQYDSIDGTISVPIKPGLHRVVFSCPRCEPVEKTVLIPDTQGAPFSFSETIRPPWKKATVTIDFSRFGEQEIYAFIQEGKQRPRVHQPDQKKQLIVPVEFSGAVPKETLTVYVYPNKPRSVGTGDLMAGALDKSAITVEPGDHLTLSFR